ncbi:hypothetical protein [Rhodococcoides kyotonense]|uniref:Uncharacterized protein n=1 Tax=Rhodococcoides kyotonense TaxID=398843 RepID=A0A239FEP2_9NOCA|nr:hypothetical protein [Rhodococcus kyotonensis]SNS54763.1 hypothetical protein SAMN05421642_103235 [Rhodococcus kyotonensis]
MSTTFLSHQIHSTVGQPLELTAGSIESSPLVTLQTEHLTEGLMDFTPHQSRLLAQALLKLADQAELLAAQDIAA